MRLKIKAFFALMLCFNLYSALLAQTSTNFKILFGSCNKVDLPNPFWEDMNARNADLFIWGGDVIYADTEDMDKMKAMYAKQLANTAYRNFIEELPVMGTWDDHDYGINDGGAAYAKKQQSQQLFLDFIGTAKDAPARRREGVYAARTFVKAGKTIKIIVLDTRYFRTDLAPSTNPEKRYRKIKRGTILGEAQWEWFKEELAESTDFTIIMSSIQLLSAQHGFETWGNLPKEVKRFEKALNKSKAQAVLVLSGDRHISEFSRKKVKGLDYPLIDFTSSGLTHSYTEYDGEPNRYRVGNVVSTRSYGMVDVDLESNRIAMKIIGVGGEILGELQQDY